MIDKDMKLAEKIESLKYNLNTIELVQKLKSMQKVVNIVVVVALFFSMVLPTFAADSINPCDQSQGTGSNNGPVNSKLCALAQGENSFSRLVGNAITIVLVLAAVIALFYLVWGGLKWILSGGDKGKVEAARSTIIAAIIGLVVTFLAYFILNFVLGLFGLGLTSLELPDLSDGPGQQSGQTAE